MEHKLTITPAINPKLRHRIEHLLEEHGYDVHGGGTIMTLESCDITFTGSHPLELNGPDALRDTWFEDGRGDVEATPPTRRDNCHCCECPEDCYRSGLDDEPETALEKGYQEAREVACGGE